MKKIEINNDYPKFSTFLEIYNYNCIQNIRDMSSIQLTDEKDLLIKISNGDKQAFTIIFNHYQKFVYSFSKRLSRSEEMALNIVQDVFLKIWANREKLSEIDNFAGYLNRIVRNHSFNVLRELSSKINNTVELEEAYYEPEYSTLQTLDYNETVRLVQEALDALSPQQRKVYELCHQQGLKYEDVAILLGISKQTVHSHMKISLSKIRKHLKENMCLFPLIALLLANNF